VHVEITLSKMRYALGSQGTAVYSLAAGLVEEASWVLAGEITLAEFGALAIATLSGPALIAASVVIGVSAVAIGAIISYIQCESGN
jgi:hypothetical protein